MPTINFDEIEKLMSELIDFHHANLLRCGRRILPLLTTDDLLQPNDFPELENHPYFRYEEGLLAGIQTVQMAFSALKQDRLLHKQ